MAQPPSTRPSLLIRIRNPKDAKAWETFVELYAPLVYGFFRRRGLQDADAADLTQEVLQGVAAGAPHLEYDRRRGRFRGWLYAIARNKLHDFLEGHRSRHRGNGDTATLKLMEALPASTRDEEQLDREYEQRAFAWAAEKVRACVDASTWRAFWLTAVEGRTGQEVSNTLGISVGAVYVAKSRVLARLKRQVEQLEGE